MRKTLMLLCSLFLAGSFSALAATVPDAGSILREQQQTPRLPDRLTTAQMQQLHIGHQRQWQPQSGPGLGFRRYLCDL